MGVQNASQRRLELGLVIEAVDRRRRGQAVVSPNPQDGTASLAATTRLGFTSEPRITYG